MRRVYSVAVQAALAEHAANGNLVYHGLAGGFLLRDAPCTLCLRLIAPAERRIRAVMADTGMDAGMAERYIREVDESRERWVKVMYGEDVADPSLYDLVINLETITIDGACALTRAAASHAQFTLDGAVRRDLEDFRLACRVRLALAEEPDLRSLDLDARVERGVVSVRGRAPVLASGRMGETMARISRSVPGVEDVRLEVEWYDPYP
jgi:hypothetical protein